MAFTLLKDDYVNDVLNSNVNSNVKYIEIDNGDGTISLQDATSYTTLGDSLDASVINTTNATVNAIGNQVLINQGDIATNASSITVLQDGKIDLNTSASPGTTDGDLTAALTAMGWLSAVIE